MFLYSVVFWSWSYQRETCVSYGSACTINVISFEFKESKSSINTQQELVNLIENIVISQINDKKAIVCTQCSCSIHEREKDRVFTCVIDVRCPCFCNVWTRVRTRVSSLIARINEIRSSNNDCALYENTNWTGGNCIYFLGTSIRPFAREIYVVRICAPYIPKTPKQTESR